MFGHHRRSFAAALVPSRRHLSRLYTVSIDTAPCAPVASHAICSLHAAAGMPRARATRRHGALTRSRGPWLGAGCPGGTGAGGVVRKPLRPARIHASAAGARALALPARRRGLHSSLPYTNMGSHAPRRHTIPSTHTRHARTRTRTRTPSETPRGHPQGGRIMYRGGVRLLQPAGP